MGKVTALMMDVITEKSGHTIVPNAVSVCLTPCAPSPVPIPYPVVGSSVEGITDPPMRTKVEGQKFATTGSVIKTCHGNEPGTLKETCSLNTAGPCFIIMGAPIVIAELGMMGITGALCISNKAITVGAGGTASGAGGAGGPGGGGGGGGAGGAGPNGPSGPSNGGGGGGGSNSGASASAASPGARGSGADAAPGTSSGPPGQHQCQNGHPVDMATGYVVDQAVDLEVAGRIPFVLRRFYSSSRRKDVRATLGPGWAHNWEMGLWEEGNVTVLRDAEGRSIFFEQIPVGGTTFHRGERMELKRITADRWEIFRLDTRWTYQLEAFEAGGQASLRHVRDAWDNRIELVYAGGRLSVILDTAGREIHVGWEGARIRRIDVRVGGASQQSVEYAYDEAGCLAAVTDALGHSETFEYDGQRRMTATTLKTGITFRYEYEGGTGRCARTWGPKGLYDLAFRYEPENHLTYADGEEPRVYTTDDSGHVTREALPNGVVLVERAYDADGLLIADANGAGHGTKHWYDARGALLRTVDAAGVTTTWEIGENDLPKRRVRPSGEITEYRYDGRGALAFVSVSSGLSYSLSYDARGRVERTVCNDGSTVVHRYDDQHNLVSTTEASGAVNSFTFDALGRPVSKSDEHGRTTTLARDRLGRVTAIRRPDGSAFTRKYDARGNLVEELDPLGNATAYRYGGMGRVTHVKTAAGAEWKLDYTSNERLASIKNPRGETYGFRYDEGGRLIAETAFDGRTTSYTRDRAGCVSRVDYADDSHRVFEYDRANRVIVDQGSDGSRIEYKRNAAGQVVAGRNTVGGSTIEVVFERDPLGRIVTERRGDRVVRYTHDPRGRLVGRVLPNGAKTELAYGSDGALARVTHASEAFEVRRGPNADDVTVVPSSGAFEARARFDAAGRLVEQLVRNPAGGEAVVHRVYDYDRAGRVARISERGGISEYEYDRVGQLVAESFAVGQERIDRAFRYDPACSLVSWLERFSGEWGREASSQSTGAWKVGPGNVLASSPTRKLAHDKRGRRVGSRDLTRMNEEAVTEYRWDVRDRLTEARLADGRRVAFEYDAFGRRTAKRVYHPGEDAPRKEVEYGWTGNCLAWERSSDGGVRTFVHVPGQDTPLLHEEAGEVLLCVTDQVGVVRELIDTSGRVAWRGRYDAWGRLLSEEGSTERRADGRVPSTPFRLLGQVHDEETGLSWTRFRVFDPTTARWLSPDPLGFRGGGNLFAFDGAPTVYVDPLGTTGDPHVHPSEVVGRTPAEIDALARERGLQPRGPAPMEGRGAYVDPATNSAVVEVHPRDNLGQPPHAHVYDSDGQRLQADGSVAPSRESPEAHLPITLPPEDT